MATLEKAKVAILRERASQGQNPDVEQGSEREVQFNPATLRLKLANVQEGGSSPGRQVRQFIGSNSATYTLELQFDSADEGSNDQPVSVRDKTAILERFLRPRARAAQPPRLRFMWGDFTIDGVVESLDLEFDHFASSGVPLRAKATLTLKEQDSTLEVLAESSQQAGQNTQRPGETGAAAPGSNGGGGNHSASAQGDETPAEFAARLGLDPSAWRGLDFDVDAGLSLSAGAAIGFSAGIGISAGLGVHVGFEAGVSASVEAGFGLSLDASVSAGASASFGASTSASLTAGFKLSASGGVEAALELNAAIEASAVVAGSVAAFGAAASFAAPADFGVSAATSYAIGSTSALGSTSASTGGPTASARARPSGPSRPDQQRTPLARADHRPGAHLELPNAPPPPRVDKRARTYGRGLPLRKRVEVLPPRPLERVETRSPAIASNPIQAPWEALPAVDRGRVAADRQQTRLTTDAACGCVCEDSTRAPWSIEREEDES